MESTIASMTKEEVLKISLTCGKLLLTSGAETYRVEDTMTRICALRDMQIAAVSTPSWIMVGDETVDGTSMVSRVTRRGTDLTLISEVNMTLRSPRASLCSRASANNCGDAVAPMLSNTIPKLTSTQ